MSNNIIGALNNDAVKAAGAAAANYFTLVSKTELIDNLVNAGVSPSEARATAAAVNDATLVNASDGTEFVEIMCHTADTPRAARLSLDFTATMVKTASFDYGYVIDTINAMFPDIGNSKRLSAKLANQLAALGLEDGWWWDPDTDDAVAIVGQIGNILDEMIGELIASNLIEVSASGNYVHAGTMDADGEDGDDPEASSSGGPQRGARKRPRQEATRRRSRDDFYAEDEGDDDGGQENDPYAPLIAALPAKYRTAAEEAYVRSLPMDKAQGRVAWLNRTKKKKKKKGFGSFAKKLLGSAIHVMDIIPGGSVVSTVADYALDKIGGPVPGGVRVETVENSGLIPARRGTTVITPVGGPMTEGQAITDDRVDAIMLAALHQISQINHGMDPVSLLLRFVDLMEIDADEIPGMLQDHFGIAS